MKLKGRKSTNIEDLRDPKDRLRADAKVSLTKKVMESPRALVDEPIAWNNDKSNLDRLYGVVNNPGRSKRFKKPPIAKSDPEPQKLSKGRKRKNYENIPDFEFFKHDIKDNK